MFADVLQIFGTMASALKATWYIVLPVAFYVIMKSLWGRHSFIESLMKQEHVLLELFPPREIERSPQTMENFFYQIAASDKTPNILQVELEGYTNPFFSFEIVGNEGTIHFYIRTQTRFRELVESALYAQYLGIEIVEAEDYTWTTIPRVVPNKEWTMWGVDYKLQNHDAYPIRTYKKFEEDVTGKMIDPLHTMMENLSILGPGQQIWIQFIANADPPAWVNGEGRAEIDRFLGREKKPDSIFSRVWKDFMDVVGGLFSGWFAPPEYSEFETGKDGNDQPIEFRLTPGEKQVLTGLEENLSKAFFNVKMRMMVVGKRDGFTKANVSATMGGIMKPFNDTFHNGFKPDSASKTDAEFLFKDTIIPRRSRVLLERYRDRDPSGVMFKLSTEEMATMFHMPDMSVTAPGVQFVGSRRGGAPPNLPFS